MPAAYPAGCSTVGGHPPEAARCRACVSLTAATVLAVHQEPHIGCSHFLPTLVSVVHPLTRIGVVLVVGRIVVSKLDVDPRSLGYLQRRSISELPVEIVMRNVEDNLFSTVRINQFVLNILGTHMRVWTEPHKLQVLQKSDIRWRCEIVAFK